jgi:uncharacterized protein YkwD
MIHLQKTVALSFISFLVILSSFSSAQLSDANKEQLRVEISEQVNTLRKSLNVTPLIFEEHLQKAAENQSTYNAKSNVLGHDQKKASLRTPTKRVRYYKSRDFAIVGENVVQSSEKKFPLNKREISQLAIELFTAWKNSPGHYANMIEKEYTFGDLGFKASKKGVVYGTQVFGKKGERIPGQLSKNSFGIRAGEKDCKKRYQDYYNQMVSLGNGVAVQGDQVVFYHHDIEFFSQVFSKSNDGLAIDVLTRDQLSCTKPNQLDMSRVHDGILLAPMYRNEILENNVADNEFRLVSQIATLPKEFVGRDDISLSLIIISNGKKCASFYPLDVPSGDYKFRPFEPALQNPATITLSTSGIIAHQELDYEFNTSHPNPIKLPSIKAIDAPIHSVVIESFTSVEGDSSKNVQLHSNRARSIQSHLEGRLKIKRSQVTIRAKENWEMMTFQLYYMQADSLVEISKDSLRSVIALDEIDLPWDSLLYEQRRAKAMIYYKGEFDESMSSAQLAQMNLRTALVQENFPQANKAIFELYSKNEIDPTFFYDRPIFEELKRHPELVQNTCAALSTIYKSNVFITTEYLFNWINRQDELSEAAKSNLLHLYALTCTELIDKWDTSSERLSNVIHPKRVGAVSVVQISNELLLNLNLTYLEYYGQVNDQLNIRAAFKFISDHFKSVALSPEDAVDLALFFNAWSMYEMTNEHLLDRYEKGTLNEDGLFTLAITISLYSPDKDAELLLKIMSDAADLNPERWCAWVNQNFQVLRNYRLKRIYCSTCN